MTNLANPRINPNRWGAKRLEKELGAKYNPVLIPLLKNKSICNLRIRDDELVKLPQGLQVHGTLNLDGCKNFEYLPDDLLVKQLIIRDCPKLKRIPDNITIIDSIELTNCPELSNVPESLSTSTRLYHIQIHNCPNIKRLPDNMHLRLLDCYHTLPRWPKNLKTRSLDLNSIQINHNNDLSLPDDLTVHNDILIYQCSLVKIPNNLVLHGTLNLEKCPNLVLGSHIKCKRCRIALCDITAIPPMNIDKSLVINGCSELIKLPDGLHVNDIINITYCPSLVELPKGLQVGPSNAKDQGLCLDGCVNLRRLPDDLMVHGRLSINGCRKLRFPKIRGAICYGDENWEQQYRIRNWSHR